MVNKLPRRDVLLVESVETGADAKAEGTAGRKNGRPPKFDEPSRPVTLTLPESTLRDLNRIDPDRASAIVKLTRSAFSDGNGSSGPVVEVINIAPQIGLVLVGPSRALRQIPFLHLVAVSHNRYFLALDTGYDFKALEIAIADLLDEMPAVGEEEEKELLVALLQQLRKLRRANSADVAEILFVRIDKQPAVGR